MEERKEMPFGRKVRVGNYTVLKYTKSLSKKEVEHLRQDIPPHIRKHLQRGGIPYIKVEAISGIWAIEFCCNTNVFYMIDGIIANDNEEQKTTLAHIFNMWINDTMVPGDTEYQEDKARAMKAFMDRCKAKDVSDEEDQKILDDMKANEEAKANIVEMANQLNEEDDDGDK